MRRVLTALFFIGALFGTAAPARAAWPSGNGKIVFIRNGCVAIETPDIDPISPDHKHADVLTAPTGGFGASSPSVSPDRTKILYASDQGHKGVTSIWVMDIDGQNPVELTHPPSTFDENGHIWADAQPSWSPNGGAIVFVSNRRTPSGPADVWTMESNGNNPLRLTSATGYGDAQPQYSPDGTSIAYVSNHVVTLMNATGSGQRPVHLPEEQSPRPQSAPTWSPSGGQLAYQSNEGTGQSTIWRATFTTEGITVKQLTVNTDTGDDDQTPSWSPDGQKIVFENNHWNMPAGSFNHRPGLTIMNADGTDPVRLSLSLTAAGDSQPSWAGDGSPTLVGVPVITGPIDIATTPPAGDTGAGDQATGGATGTTSSNTAGGAGAGATTGAGTSTLNTTTATLPRFGSTKLKAKKGVATIAITLSAAGKVKASGKGVTTTTVSAKAGGNVSVKLHLTAAEAKLLKKKHKVNLTLTVTFTPKTGTPVSAKQTVSVSG